MYHEYENSSSANDFLKDFVIEAAQLIQNGFMYREHILSFIIKSFICDVPAKSFITYTKSHMISFHVKCIQKEEYVKNRVCFLKLIQKTEQIKIFIISYNLNIT